MNTTSDFFKRVKRQFISELVNLSDGAISKKDAIKIANANLRPTDFNDDSPIQHKSIKWLAMNYLNRV